MTETTGHVVLATHLRRLIDTARSGRLRVLGTALHGSADGTRDEEALHDFRVSLRRIRTFLRTARILWSSKQWERIEDELRYYARTTGSLRDDEVLRETLHGLSLPRAAQDEIGAWLVRRARASRSRHAAIFRILQDGPSPIDIDEEDATRRKRIRPLDRTLNKLDQLLSTEPTHPSSPAKLARIALDRAIRDVVRAAAAEVHDVDAMHALRIREKRLRYTAELFASELADEASTIAKHATRMQRHLGELHDLDEAITTVVRARGLARATQQAVIAALRAARTSRAAKVEPHLVDTRSLETRLGSSPIDSQKTPSP